MCRDAPRLSSGGNFEHAPWAATEGRRPFDAGLSRRAQGSDGRRRRFSRKTEEEIGRWPQKRSGGIFGASIWEDGRRRRFSPKSGRWNRDGHNIGPLQLYNSKDGNSVDFGASREESPPFVLWQIRRQLLDLPLRCVDGGIRDSFLNLQRLALQVLSHFLVVVRGKPPLESGRRRPSSGFPRAPAARGGGEAAGRRRRGSGATRGPSGSHPLPASGQYGRGDRRTRKR